MAQGSIRAVGTYASTVTTSYVSPLTLGPGLWTIFKPAANSSDESSQLIAF